MPLCQYCDIDPCNSFSRVATVTFRRWDRIEETLHCLSHHSQVSEMVACAFGDNGCVLCELFLLYWHRSGLSRLGLHQAGGGTIVRPPEGSERSQITWLVKHWEDKEAQAKPTKDYRLFLSCAETTKGLTLWRLRNDTTAGAARLGNGVAHLEFYFRRNSLPQDSSTMTKAIWRRDISYNARDESCLGLAASWLQDCLHNHQICKEYAPPLAVLPTRVIDVGLDGMSPRLHFGASAPSKFTALSYCWGSGAGFRLTLLNVERFQHDIPVHCLPQVVKDAMTVTHAMGIQYLWVDAICIIQDSEEDWIREAARMNEVFGNATIVLVAECSNSAEQGFLCQRYVSPTCSLPWRPSERRSDDSTRPTDRVYVGFKDDRNMNGNRSAVYDEPARNGLGVSYHPQWHCRGWTLQEGLSAARTLTYGIFEIKWQCLCTHVNEDGKVEDKFEDRHHSIDLLLGRDPSFPDGASNQHFFGGLTTIWTTLIRSAALQLQRMSTDEYEFLVIHQFQQIINELSKRKLTFRSDLSAAIAGLAKGAESQLSGRVHYYAGLWSNCITLGLLWHCQIPDKEIGHIHHKDRERIARNPSWSWTSVLKSHYSTPITSPAASITSGSSLLKHIRFADVDDSERFIPQSPIALKFRAPYYRLSENWLSEQVVLDDQYFPFMLFEKWLQDAYSKAKEAAYEFEEKHRPYLGQHFAAIQIYKRIEAPSRDDSFRSIREPRRQIGTKFLILESVQSADQNCYRRVMMLELPQKHGRFAVRPGAFKLVYEIPWAETDIILL